MLQTSPQLRLKFRTPALLRPVIASLRSKDLLFRVIAVGWVAWLLVGAARDDRWAYLPITTITLAAVWWLVPAVSHLRLPLPPVDSAVGRAAFVGESLVARQAAVLAAVFAAALVGLAAGLVSRSRGPRVGVTLADREAQTPEKSRWRHGWILVVCLVVAGALANFVGVLTVRRWGYNPNWDLDNILYWRYLAFHGWLPYRDYFYPYAGFFVFDWPAPAGPLLQAVFEAVVPGVFALAFFRVSGRRLGMSIAATALLVLGQRGELFPMLSRYLMCANVLLAYVAIDRTRGARISNYGLFWVACGLALFFEPAQLIYGSLGIGAIVIWNAIEHPRGPWRPFASHLAYAFLAPVFLGAILLGWMKYTNQLSGFLALYLRLGDSVAYGALPTDVVAQADLPSSVAFLLLMLAPVLVGVGVFERTRQRLVGVVPGSVLLGLGLVAVMLLQKHLVRPVEAQLAYLVPLGVLSAMSVARGRRTTADRVVIGFLLGGVAAALTTSNAAVVAAWGPLHEAPRRVVAGWSALFDRQALQASNQRMFSDVRFAAFVDEQALAKRLCVLNGGSAPETFVLSDDPVLYILLHSRPVYHASLYSSSPIYDQMSIVNWLSRRQIPFVVFSPLRLTYDGFAKAVRAPIVFSRVVTDYVPADRLSQYEITRRRRPDEPIALDYWREKLGPSLNLGHLPRLSSVGRLGPCLGESTCQDFAEVTLVAPPAKPAPVSLSLEAAGRPFDVTFQVVPRITVYHVSLDRLWFWTAARSFGQEVRVTKEGLVRGVNARVVRRASDPTILY